MTDINKAIKDALVEFYGERYCGRCEDHHGILDEDNDENLLEAIAKIKALVVEQLPNEKKGVKQVFDIGSQKLEQTILSDINLGFNQCLGEIRSIFE